MAKIIIAALVIIIALGAYFYQDEIVVQYDAVVGTEDGANPAPAPVDPKKFEEPPEQPEAAPAPEVKK